MSLWRQLKHGIRSLWNRTASVRDIDDEATHYLEEMTADLEARGLPPDDARRTARLNMGSGLAVREQVQDAFWERTVSGLVEDCRYAIRRLARSPGFTATALLTLSLGIGGTAALFALIDSVLLRPLPYPESDRLVALVHKAPGIHVEYLRMSPSLYFTYREESNVFESIALWNGRPATVLGNRGADEVPTLFVTHEFLHVLRVQPALGRDFSAADDDWREERSVLLSHAYWLQEYGGAVSALGSHLTVDGQPHRIIGVLPAGFEFLDERISLVVPKRLRREAAPLMQFNDDAIARLKPGVTLAQANADIALCLPMAPAKFPSNPGFPPNAFADARVTPDARYLKQHLIGNIGDTLWVLMGGVTVLLLIACANVANLLVVRASSRQQELLVRAALGAGWSRLARELLAESILLAMLGGLLGLGLCGLTLRLVAVAGIADLPRVSTLSVSFATIVFTFVVSVTAGFVFGLIPVWKYARPLASQGAQGAGRWTTASRERRRAGRALVVCQVALTMVLLVGAVLMLRTLQVLHSVDPGFSHPGMVQLARVSIVTSQVANLEQVVRMQEAILRQFQAVPGVAAVSAANSAPMEGGASAPLLVEDRQDPPNTPPRIRAVRNVTPGFAASIGSRMVAGRDFQWEETHRAAPVVMVSESLARELWGSASAALGRRIRQSTTDPWQEIIGIVADLRDDGLRQEAARLVYLPILQRTGETLSVTRNLDVMIRSPRAGSTAFVEELREALNRVSPNVALARVRTLDSVYRRSLARTAFAMRMLAGAALIALLLGMVGIYGVVAYSVSRRIREIGIRLALGCPAQQVVKVFLWEGLGLATFGVALGAVAALAASQGMQALLFGVNTVDPVTYATVLSVLIGIASIASWLPARRAATVNPVDSLRTE